MKSAPDEAKLFDSFLSLYEATDYTVALAGPALLDHYLEIKLTRSFAGPTPEEAVALFDFNQNGPLNDFAPKIKVAHAFGLLERDTYDDLKAIKEIRNAFAHAKTPISFQSPAVKAMCAEIKVLEQSTPTLKALKPLLPRGFDAKVGFALQCMLLYVVLQSSRKWSEFLTERDQRLSRIPE